MRTVVVALLLSLVALSGCTSDDTTNDEPSGTDTAGENGPEQGSESGTGGDESNSTSTPDGAFAFIEADPVAAEAPATITFTFGVNGTPEGTTLTWTLDANGDGTLETEGTEVNLPGNFSFTFADPGTFNATFEATDGTDSWNASLALDITEALGGEEPPSDCEAPEAPYFLDNADDTTADWTHSEADAVMGNWHQSSQHAQSGDNSWAATIEPVGIYGDAVNIWMESPAIDLTCVPSASLGYAVQGGSELDYDMMFVQISTGGSYTDLASYSGTLDSWQSELLNLNKYTGSVVTLRFQFVSDSNCSGVTPVPICDLSMLGPGWFVDDITIQ